MTDDPAAGVVNRFLAVRAGYGATLLLAPDRVISWGTGHAPDRTTRRVVRVLGARHLTQAVLSLGVTGRVAQALAAEVDALHSLSMLGVAALDPQHRRGGLTDAAAAGCFAAAGALLTARLPPDQPSPTDSRGLLLGTARMRARAATAIARRTLPAALLRRLVATRFSSRRQGCPAGPVGRARPDDSAG